MLSTRYQADFHLLAAAYGALPYTLAHGVPWAIQISGLPVLEISGLPIAQYGIEVPTVLGDLGFYCIDFFFGFNLFLYFLTRFGGTWAMLNKGSKDPGMGEEISEALKRLEVEGKPYLFFQDF